MDTRRERGRTLEERERARRRARKRRRRRAMMIRSVLSVALLVCVVGGAIALTNIVRRMNNENGARESGRDGTAHSVSASRKNQEVALETEKATERKETETEKSPLQQAELLAMGYDYDGAIALLKGVPGYESNAEMTQAIQKYEQQKASCVAVDVTKVPHIFYHSLVNDTDSAFNVSVLGQSAVDGMNAWMTTVEEFDKITQQMYDNGYVFVRLRDLVVETKDENGQVHFAPNTNLMLPPDKKPVVLSVDDLSYYHSYEKASYPDKLVLDEKGQVKCHYVKPDGTEEVGDFDVVPRLNTFLEKHPDGAYKGARGMIALTGYNGVFGYRTDSDYKLKQNLMEDQKKWLDEHPDFNWDQEVEEAKKIAEAIKASGWEFASHTWGHLSVTNRTAEQLKTDNEKWVATVQNIVGPVDTIIFAHGNDIGDWQGYSDSNEKYRYYKEAGYNFFCNVDSSTPYWVQIQDQYVRQGRIDLDGYLLYKATQGGTDVLNAMFSPQEVFDRRRPVPVVANGEG
ncbi:MAG TPA: polysaccharide deacetylase family protein [Candidatus Limivivens merdigallinarum]|uniref:Polysaccharide deacetylase family protein n=1 Tax=Candidatus Limivivens merdigallinarum TaxID=2840859 RepID=A0A9D1D226_9FIRM|nr:polysaccharide deacetylase family protein [Candidatus Limivivens merdigallinarum]